MEQMKIQSGETIARKNDTVKYWYVLQEGSVMQKLSNLNIRLEKNAIVGICEKDNYLSDYVAETDVVLLAFPGGSSEELKNFLTSQEALRKDFLRVLLEQRHRLLSLHVDLYQRAQQYHYIVELEYNRYKTFCGKYKVEEAPFPIIERFNALEMQHKAEKWEIDNSISVVKKYMQEYLQLMSADVGLMMGVLMESAAQMRRFAQGIVEVKTYLSCNKNILFADGKNDLFQLFFDLAKRVYAKKYEIEPIQTEMKRMLVAAEKFKIYLPRFLQRRAEELQQYDFEKGESTVEGEESASAYADMDIFAVDCMGCILEYAGCTAEETEQYEALIRKYENLPDTGSSDRETYALRKQVTSIYYDIYSRVFLHSMKENTENPVIQMFLNFGFMDTSFLTEEQVEELYALSGHIDICQSEHIYTIYEWLKCVYNGTKPASKNEFDLSYPAYLAEQRKRGDLTEKEVKEALYDKEKRVLFEIQNMFTSVNKITYGRITSFCPILNGKDLINSVEKMLITAERMEEAMNSIRKIDYSVFYREVLFSDPDHGINAEQLMKEVLPDIILMPNAGERAIMWQETSGVKTDTPGRMMFPIFTAADVDGMMLEVTGAFRWELCRRIEGARWNDVREKSLTAEFYTYIQFYRKNSELSAEAKEKLKTALVRAKNNYREVFVKDYINWMKFESKGSFRLNKVARDILARYCPFSKNIRDELRANPLYQTMIMKVETEAAQKLQRYNGVYDKYTKAGGTITEDLRANLLFYEL